MVHVVPRARSAPSRSRLARHLRILLGTGTLFCLFIIFLTPLSNKAGGTVAFAVSITGCGSDPITEGAAVLKHSIHRSSIHGTLGGRYDYKLFAIYHPSAEECALPLQELGYNMMKRDVFVQVSEIQGDFLRSRIESNGCCGEKELIKLEAYTLTDFPIVVHLDLDVLVLKPLNNNGKVC